MSSKSLLLHALSLRDRILEPNNLPISGQVWAYDKESCSREMFVGNCITMLSVLGMQDAEVSWNKDIMAFDATWQGQPYTVIISLQDDSLASDYFYFLGVWTCPQQMEINSTHPFGDSTPWDEEDLLKPAISYAVRIFSDPLQYPDMQHTMGGDFFGQSIYDGHYYLCGQTDMNDYQNGNFVICPTSHRQNHARHEIRHALYSIRNLMALMTRTVGIYGKSVGDDAGMRLYQDLMMLMHQADKGQIAPDEWDQLVRQNGKAALRAAEISVRYHSLQGEVAGIEKLFAAIRNELNISEMHGIPSLMQRMETPFGHARDALGERLDIVHRSERQAQILQQLLHSRMLARQQELLKLIAEKVSV